MPFSLAEIAKAVNGQTVNGKDISISSVNQLAFILSPQSLEKALASPAAALVIKETTRPLPKPAIMVKDPRLAMAKILLLFAPVPKPGKIHKSAVIDKTAKIGKHTAIGAYSVIGENCKIGANCIIHSGVNIYPGTEIKNNVILHSGCVIGVDGFGFAQDENKKHVKIPQIGKVVIEDDVEIFANCTIARATLNETRIKRGTKIDCLCHIAHNCEVGQDCAFASGVGVSGSVTIKDRVLIGGQVGFNNHITVGSNSLLMGRAGITKDVPEKTVVSGFPAQEHKKELKQQALIAKLPEIYQRLKILEEKNK